MAEMATAIMVVSLPSMRASLRRGGFLGIFRTGKTEGSSASRSDLDAGKQRAGSSQFRVFSRRNRSGLQSVADDDESGSEVELNHLGRNDAIYKTRRVSIRFTGEEDLGAECKDKTF